MRHSFLAGGIAAALVLCAGAQAGLIAEFQCFDHPDGIENPPPYGVRFDHIFAGLPGASGGIASFSMNAIGDTRLRVYDDGGGDLRITITGTIFGGEDAGMTYAFGQGAYALDFEFDANVAPSGTGWVVNPNSALNNGTITSLGNPDVPMGTSFTFFDKVNDEGKSFLFLQDDHRLAGYPEAGQGFWVGRGWFETDPMGGGTRDFLFIAEKIPAPGVIPMMLGAGMMFSRRRNRA